MSYKNYSLSLALLASLATLGFSHAAMSSDTPLDLTSIQQLKIKNDVQSMRNAALNGPQKIELGSQATLNLPQNFTYIPVKEATEFMHDLGNQTGSGFEGLVFVKGSDGFVSIEYVDSGHIKDDEARSWDTDALLKNLKSNTEENNSNRISKGIPALEVLGWIEKPDYDSTNHWLVWSAAIQDKGQQTPEAEQGVNYNTYLLGREGFLSLNLVTDRAHVESDKKNARILLDSVEFKTGQQYGDFNASTDKIAEYGLAALIGGLVVKKMGLLAVIGVTLLKLWKIVLVGAGAVLIGIKKLLARKKESS